MIINTPNIEAAKKLIKSAHKPIIIQAQDDVFNRKVLEYGKFDVLLDIHAGHRTDSLRQLDAGFNEILGRIAAKNNVALGIDLARLASLDKKHKACSLTRLRQNIAVARKTGTKLTILNTPNTHTAKSLLISLGASTQQAKHAVS